MPTIRPRSDAGPFSYLPHIVGIRTNPLLRYEWLLLATCVALPLHDAAIDPAAAIGQP